MHYPNTQPYPDRYVAASWNAGVLNLTVASHFKEINETADTNKYGDDITTVEKLIEHIDAMEDWDLLHYREADVLREQARGLTVTSDGIYGGTQDGAGEWALTKGIVDGLWVRI